MANGGGGRTDGRTDGRMEIPPCVLQDIGPLGPLPKKGGSDSHFRDVTNIRVFIGIVVEICRDAL